MSCRLRTAFAFAGVLVIDLVTLVIVRSTEQSPLSDDTGAN